MSVRSKRNHRSESRERQQRKKQRREDSDESPESDSDDEMDLDRELHPIGCVCENDMRIIVGSHSWINFGSHLFIYPSLTCDYFRYYINDRAEMIEQIFSVIKGAKLKAMLTSTLRDIPLEELKTLCLEQLEGMSKKRIRYLIAGP